MLLPSSLWVNDINRNVTYTLTNILHLYLFRERYQNSCKLTMLVVCCLSSTHLVFVRPPLSSVSPPKNFVLGMVPNTKQKCERNSIYVWGRWYVIIVQVVPLPQYSMQNKSIPHSQNTKDQGVMLSYYTQSPCLIFTVE